MLSLARATGDRWTLRGRRGKLDAYGVPDIYNPVSQGRSRYRSFELGWEGRLAGHDLGVQLGHETQSPDSAGDADGVFGFIRWRKALN